MIYWQLISPILWIFIIEFNINAAGKYSMNAVELSDFYYSTADEEKKKLLARFIRMYASIKAFILCRAWIMQI